MALIAGILYCVVEELILKYEVDESEQMCLLCHSSVIILSEDTWNSIKTGSVCKAKHLRRVCLTIVAVGKKLSFTYIECVCL